MWSGIGIGVLGVAAVGVHHILTKPKSFHVDVKQLSMKMAGINIFPLVRKVMSLLPESTRRNFTVKMSVPTRQPRDRYDFTGESPYTVTELEAGKIWKVVYDMEMEFLVYEEDYEQFKVYVGDVMSDEFEEVLLAGALTQGERFKGVAKKDMETMRYWITKAKTCEQSELKDLPYWTLKMIVVKLNSGSLLLYAPVIIRKEVEFGDWLDELGPVEWIVLASNSHTKHVKVIVDRYPNAKVVGPLVAEEKVKYVTKLPRGKFDFYSTNKDDLLEVNAKLKDEGCELFNLNGDLVNAVHVKCGSTLLGCDLVYGHHDGCGTVYLDKEKFEECAPDDWWWRIWKFCLINRPNSPHGFIPNYRYWFFDLNAFGVMMCEPPAADGSNCKLMANSLRELLKMNFDSVVCCHGNASEMSGDDFRKTIDKSWSWLDGKPLIE